MSSTSVKVKASSAHSEVQSAMPKGMGGMSDASPPNMASAQGVNPLDGGDAQDAGHLGGDAAMKTAFAPYSDTTKRTKSAPSPADDSGKRASSAFDGIVKKVQPYLDKHGHAVVYGIVGIVAAILILTIGFWPVLLLAVFAAIGIAIGKFRDSGMSMQSAAKSLAENLRR